MLQRKEITLSVLIIISFVFILTLMSQLGKAGRVYHKGFQLEVMPMPMDGYQIWKESGVRGQILIHFDRKINSDVFSGTLTNSNYITAAMRDNIIRKAYHVIPDKAWDEVNMKLKNISSMSENGKIIRITIEGVPVLIVKMDDIPSIGETVLLNINGNFWSDKEIRRMLESLRNGAIDTDIVSFSGKVSGENRRFMREIQ
jgi:hypothetical protein